MIRLSFKLLFAVLVTLSTPALASEIVGQATVVDGDTINIGRDRIRLEGIDAPESAQWCLDRNGAGYRCGRDASFALADKIGRSHVRCEIVGLDQYDRALGRCYLGKVELNDWMVRQGHALAFLRYSNEYVSAERDAKSRRVGMWKGTFDKPWDWRRDGPTIGAGGQALKLASQQECAIKGNISKKGEKIYHSPGQQHYGRTKINERAGERWFCSRQEAEAAGWRAAKR